MKRYGKKLRISGLYLDENTVRDIERLRIQRLPVPSFNRQILDLLKEVLEEKRTCQKEVPRRWRT